MRDTADTGGGSAHVSREATPRGAAASPPLTVTRWLCRNPKDYLFETPDRNGNLPRGTVFVFSSEPRFSELSDLGWLHDHREHDHHESLSPSQALRMFHCALEHGDRVRVDMELREEPVE